MMAAIVMRAVGVVFLAAVVAAYSKIKEKDLTVLTLYQGKYTTARRTDPIPQLSCQSNCKHAPQTVQCKATGWDGERTHWKCDAMLPEGVFFGTADVSCEGYDYPGDPYVTVGSCGLSYTLTGKNAGSDDFSGKMPMILMGIVFVVLLVKWCGSNSNSGYDRQPSGDDDSNHGRSFFGGGGGGGFGDNTTPGFRPDYYSAGGGCGGSNPQGHNGPGFWSGVATGGLAGYLFGRNGVNDYAGYGGNYDYVRNRDGFSSSAGPSTSRTRSTSAFASTSRR